MNLNEEIRDAFREGDQTANGRLVTALTLMHTVPEEELLEFVQYTINYVHDLNRAAAMLILLGTGRHRKGTFKVETWSGRTTFLSPMAYVSEVKETVEYTMSVLESAPFGDKLVIPGDPVTNASIIVDENTLEMILNISRWAESTNTPNTQWQCTLLGNELQEELNQLAWVALEVSERTADTFRKILKIGQ